MFIVRQKDYGWFKLLLQHNEHDKCYDIITLDKSINVKILAGRFNLFRDANAKFDKMVFERGGLNEKVLY